MNIRIRYITEDMIRKRLVGGMKELITAKIQEVYHQSPKEFCEDAFGDGMRIGGIQ